MNGKKSMVVCYFYDESGNPLKDMNSSYKTVSGDVSSSVDITPSYERSIYTDLEVRIPKSELHLNGVSERRLKVQVVVWENSNSEFVELFRSDYVEFTFAPSLPYLKVDGSTSDKTLSFNADGGRRTFQVSTDALNYDIWGVPSWCTVEDRSSSSFTIRCLNNSSSEDRSDFIYVKAAGKEIRIDIFQDGRKGPSAEINRVWVDHNIVRGYGYGATNGMLIHTEISVENLKNQTVTIQALFYYGDNTTPLFNAYGGQVSVSGSGNVSHDSGVFNDFQLYLPYPALRIYGHGTSNLSFDVLVKDKAGNILARMNNTQFIYTQ